MAANWWSELRGNVPRKWAILLGLVPLLLLFALWWSLTRGPSEERVIPVTILPSPGEVLRSSLDYLQQRDAETGSSRLVHHTWLSLRRVLLGYLCALVVVFPLGVLMGSFGSVRAAFGPLTAISGYIPIATLAPLTMSWFGTDDKQKVFFLALAFGIYLLPLIFQAINSVPDVYLRTAYTLGASRGEAIWSVLIPIAMPDIWQAMRLAFGVGWTYLVLTESIVMAGGLGEIVMIAQRRGPREHIYLTILVITLVAWCSDLLWDRLGRALFPYRRRAS